MPDCGERPDEENERRLETVPNRDPPPIDYGAELLERSLPPQQQQQSGGRRLKGGIMSRGNYKGFLVNIRPPKWEDSKLWINTKDHPAAQFNADAAFYLTGRPPVHFPDENFRYPPLRLSTGEELKTSEECSVYVAEIAKGPALLGRRKDFKNRAEEYILKIEKSPEVVEFLKTRRGSPSQPRPAANPVDLESPCINRPWNKTAVEADISSEKVLASTVIVGVSQCGSLVPVAEETYSDDGGGEDDAPMEVDAVSLEAFKSYCQDVDVSTPFIPSYGMDVYEPENLLCSAKQSLGICFPLFVPGKENLVPGSYEESSASLNKDEEETWKATKLPDWEPWSPPPPFVPYSPLSDPDGTDGGH